MGGVAVVGRRLVRDRALETWRVPGAEHQVRPVTDVVEHLDLLRRKVMEEAAEVAFAYGTDELIKEAADVIAVIQGLCAVNGVAFHEVMAAVSARQDESGGFARGMVWETDR